MASRHVLFTVLASASIVIAAGLSFLYLVTDDTNADEGDYGSFHWVMDNNDNLTISGHGHLDLFESSWTGCLNLTINPDGETSIGDNVFRSCNYLTSVTINGSVDSFGVHAFVIVVV